MPTMIYLVAVMVGVTVRRPGLWYFSSLERLPLCSTILTLSQLFPLKVPIYPLYNPVRKKRSHLLHPSKVRSVVSASSFEDLLLCNASILIFQSVLRSVLLPSFPSHRMHPFPFLFNIWKFCSPTLQGLSVLHTQFTWCSLFSLHYPSLSSFMMCSSLDFPDVASTSVLLLYMMGSETHGTFWRWLIMRGNPTEE